MLPHSRVGTIERVKNTRNKFKNLLMKSYNPVEWLGRWMVKVKTVSPDKVMEEVMEKRNDLMHWGVEC